MAFVVIRGSASDVETRLAKFGRNTSFRIIEWQAVSLPASDSIGIVMEYELEPAASDSIDRPNNPSQGVQKV